MTSLGQPSTSNRTIGEPGKTRPLMGYREDVQAWTLFIAPIFVTALFLVMFNWRLAFA
jgi:hypothetical protein